MNKVNICVKNGGSMADQQFCLKIFLNYLLDDIKFSISKSSVLAIREGIVFNHVVKSVILTHRQIVSYIALMCDKVNSNQDVSCDCAILMISLLRMFIECEIITN